MWKEPTVDRCAVQSSICLEGLRKGHGKSQVRIVASRPRIELEISDYEAGVIRLL
jgi:hypothetical protein